MARMRVPRAQQSSWEDVLHRARSDDKLIILDELQDVALSSDVRGHRAIGVVYHPDREFGNYVPTVLPQRYDAFLFIDESQALHPLHIQPQQTAPPDTYPWGV
jgi:erythromycin esterase-like protein